MNAPRRLTLPQWLMLAELARIEPKAAASAHNGAAGRYCKGPDRRVAEALIARGFARTTEPGVWSGIYVRITDEGARALAEKAGAS